MIEVVIPKANNNDEAYQLVEKYFENFDEIDEGEIIATFETSKAAFDLEAERAGIILFSEIDEAHVSPGKIFAYLFQSQEEAHEYHDKTMANPLRSAERKKQSKVITAPAQKLIEEHGISEKEIQSISKSIIKKNDIEKILQKQPSQSTVLNLSKYQKRIAETVSLSHSSIPTAYLVLKFHMVAFKQFKMQEEFNDIDHITLMCKLIARQIKNHPFFFTCYTEPTIKMNEKAHIGITYDLGKGLFIPVIHDVDKLSIQDIHEKCFDFKIKAMRGNFKEEELQNGNFTVSINSQRDIDVVMPIIYPEQSCILSINAVQCELTLDSSNVVEREYFKCTLAYDHRLINGSDAFKFLNEIKQKFESLERIKEHIDATV